jgi:hypothetical protein
VRPESLEIRIIDALERQINASPHLAPHQTVLYKRPRAVLPGDCPLLAIFLIQKAFTAETVTYYDTALAVGVTWQEEGNEEVTTLVDEPDMAKSQLRAISAIEEVILRLSIEGLEVERVEVDDGTGREADAAYAVYPVGVDLSDPIQVEEGLVEGYAMTVEVDATQTKQGG